MENMEKNPYSMKFFLVHKWCFGYLFNHKIVITLAMSKGIAIGY